MTQQAQTLTTGNEIGPVVKRQCMIGEAIILNMVYKVEYGSATHEACENELNEYNGPHNLLSETEIRWQNAKG
ncbi:hypothetical protein [Pedobacter sp. JY14-1]|uniref:hypothetical protein n=1 Tax=Pedobacter sp. JY14-1 TaxID=3034151 RepID=UPI0023E28D06|nr:hypothetical protein [Pedobacter sp. JY14-1]